MLFTLVTFIIASGMGAAISHVKLLGIGIRTIGGLFSALFFLAALAVLILLFLASIIF